jgi:hypothetical protein
MRESRQRNDLSLSSKRNTNQSAQRRSVKHLSCLLNCDPIAAPRWPLRSVKAHAFDMRYRALWGKDPAHIELSAEDGHGIPFLDREWTRMDANSAEDLGSLSAFASIRVHSRSKQSWISHPSHCSHLPADLKTPNQAAQRIWPIALLSLSMQAPARPDRWLWRSLQVVVLTKQCRGITLAS